MGGGITPLLLHKKPQIYSHFFSRIYGGRFYTQFKFYWNYFVMFKKERPRISGAHFSI